jgi:hypothetical protein
LCSARAGHSAQLAGIGANLDQRALLVRAITLPDSIQ